MSVHASIDIGSNTLLLLIAERRDDEWVTMVDECDFGLLGKGLAQSGMLSAESIANSLGILRRYRALLDKYHPDSLQVVGTQALRQGRNRDDFLTPAREILGVDVEVIAGEREAQLAALAAARSLPALDTEQWVVDVGGASTEFILLAGGSVKTRTSLPMGAVTLSDSFLGENSATEEERERLYAAIDDKLASLPLQPGSEVIGSAGTATTVGSIHLALSQYDSEKIHALSLPAEVVHQCSQRLLDLSVEDKRNLVGLEPKRAPVIAGGVAIYSRVLRKLGDPSFTICDRGIRWGLLFEAAEQSN